MGAGSVAAAANVVNGAADFGAAGFGSSVVVAPAAFAIDLAAFD